MSLMPFPGRDVFGEDFFGPLMRMPGGPAGPALMGDMARPMPLDVVEQDDKFEVKADVPGVDKGDIKVTVDNNILKISVEKATENKEDKEEAGRKYHRYERSSTFVGRSLRMPENANLDDIKARYENGVLKLDVPKRDVGEKTKRIEVS